MCGTPSQSLSLILRLRVNKYENCKGKRESEDYQNLERENREEKERILNTHHRHTCLGFVRDNVGSERVSFGGLKAQGTSSEVK